MESGTGRMVEKLKCLFPTLREDKVMWRSIRSFVISMLACKFTFLSYTHYCLSVLLFPLYIFFTHVNSQICDLHFFYTQQNIEFRALTDILRYWTTENSRCPVKLLLYFVFYISLKRFYSYLIRISKRNTLPLLIFLLYILAALTLEK